MGHHEETRAWEENLMSETDAPGFGLNTSERSLCLSVDNVFCLRPHSSIHEDERVYRCSVGLQVFAGE